MQRTRCVFFDSFKAARGELEPLFAAMKSDEHMRKEVRQYILPSLSRRRPRFVNERLGRSQQRSLFRTNVSLVLQEARRRANYRVAAAALNVALAEAQPAHLAQDFDPAWVKDAVASCQSVEELRVMEGVLRRHEQQLLASGTAAGTEGFLLTAAFGRSAAATQRGRRLGDDSVEAMENEEEHAALSNSSTAASSSSFLVHNNDATVQGEVSAAMRNSGGHANALLQLSEEESAARVSAALTQPPSSHTLALHGGSGVDESLWASPQARAAAGLRRLHRQRSDVTAGPNVSFTRYFLHQGLVRSESELMSLYQAMRSRPQDVAFRVVGGGKYNNNNNKTADAQRKSDDVRGVDALVSPYADAVHALLHRRRGIHAVPWLPAGMGAYTLDTRDSVPQDTVEVNRHLVRSLAKERLVVYQSLSSMLPVFYLDPQPGERILDLCASPGNKTGLILDTMHGAAATATTAAASSTFSHKKTNVYQSGCVVANEAQPSRLRDLQERLRDASPEVAVTRGRGEDFGPTRSASSRHDSGAGGAQQSSSSSSNLFTGWESFADGAPLGQDGLYDGVLVDAPCSGEGRMGRDALSWRLWHPGRGLEFFPLQCALLQRAVRLCRTGGRVVYATCTLNPIENEAVVAAVLRACGGAVELVPPPPLPSSSAASDNKNRRGSNETSVLESGEEGQEVAALQLSPGLRRWDVPSSAGGFLRTPADAYAQGESRQRLLPEMFALEGSGDDSAVAAASEELSSGDVSISAALHRCCRRVMPHRNGGTDGFFVAVLRKKSSMGGALRSISATSASAAVLSPSSSSALAVSFAGGSNMLNDRGLVRLQASNHLVQKHLGGFFTSAATSSTASSLSASGVRHANKDGWASVRDFLEKYGWTAMWCEGEGLRLLSTQAVQLLHSHATTAHTSAGGNHGSGGKRDDSQSIALRATDSMAELLDAGVLVVSAQGELTERGAALIRNGASSRVLSLPLPYAQLLLANRTLDIGGSLKLMPAFMQEAEHARTSQHGLLKTAAAQTATATARESPQWCLDALGALQPAAAAGNAIVGIDVSSHGTTTAAAAADVWAAPMARWSWPVRVEVLRAWTGPADAASGLVRLHLCLPPSSRHRVLALVGRLQGHAHRLRSPQAQQQQTLRAGAAYNPADQMDSRELYGVPVQASRQHRQLQQRGAERNYEAAAAASAPGTGAKDVAAAGNGETPSTVFEL